jgi:hypothetical protein
VLVRATSGGGRTVQLIEGLALHRVEKYWVVTASIPRARSWLASVIHCDAHLQSLLILMSDSLLVTASSTVTILVCWS